MSKMMRPYLLIILSLVVSAITYYFYCREPENRPTDGVTLVVGKVEYALDHNVPMQSVAGFEITIRFSRIGNFTVTTDENGMFSFPVWAGSDVWLNSIEVANAQVESSNQPHARLHQRFVAAESGVSNIGSVRWISTGLFTSLVTYPYDWANSNQELYRYTYPDSPWVHEKWHRLQSK